MRCWLGDAPGIAKSVRKPRVAVLWDALSGYLHASLRALVDEGADVLVFHREAMTGAPFDTTAITGGLDTRPWSSAPDVAELERALQGFSPDALLVCSWHIGGYRRAARHLQGRALRIVTFHNQWRATPKQWGGVLVSRAVIRPTFDAAFVCDERQANFAAKLGFPAERLLWGTNTCDHPRFAAVARRRGDALPPEAFVFAGRLVPDKAIDVLADGYGRYRDAVDDPWPLLVAGIGPDEHLLTSLDGVELLGFVQPPDLPEVFARAGCLVLPSRFEPWGVVVHEAAAAGLPVICSRECGASTRLVLDGYNGVVVSPGSAGGLASALRRIHGATDDERRAMGVASESLALQYTPERWARTLLGRIPELRGEIGLDPMPWRPRTGAVAADEVGRESLGSMRP